MTVPVGFAYQRGEVARLMLVVDDRSTALPVALMAFAHSNRAKSALVQGQAVPLTIDDLLEDWELWQDTAMHMAECFRDDPSLVSDWVDLDSVVWDPPLARDPLMLFAAANYSAHTQEAEKSDLVGQKVGTGDGDPYLFQKPIRSVVGSTDPVVKPFDVEQMDWEVELALVIGRSGRRIERDNAMSHVAGYMVCNDLSARDFVRRPDWPMFSSDWFAQKSFDTFTPIGPVLVPRAAIPDIDSLRLRLWVGDQLMQDGHVGEMLFSIPEQIEFASRFVTLKPGDVISTGTPAGVGMATGRYLQAGETMTTQITSLGRQVTTVLDEVSRVSSSV